MAGFPHVEGKWGRQIVNQTTNQDFHGASKGENWIFYAPKGSSLKVSIQHKGKL